MCDGHLIVAGVAHLARAASPPVLVSGLLGWHLDLWGECFCHCLHAVTMSEHPCSYAMLCVAMLQTVINLMGAHCPSIWLQEYYVFAAFVGFVTLAAIHVNAWTQHYEGRR